MHCVRALATRMPRSCRRVSRMCAGFAVGTVVLGGRARVVGFGGGFGFEQVVVCIWVSCQHNRALQLMAISATTRGRPMATLQNHRGQRLVDAAGQEIKAGSDRGVVVGSLRGKKKWATEGTHKSALFYHRSPASFVSICSFDQRRFSTLCAPSAGQCRKAQSVQTGQLRRKRARGLASERRATPGTCTTARCLAVGK